MTRDFLVFIVTALLLFLSSNPVFAEKSAADGRILKIALVESGVVSVGENRCAGHCSFRYEAEKTVKLKASPAQGWTFVGWEDDCSGSDGCTLVMDGDKTVTALFTYP